MQVNPKSTLHELCQSNHQQAPFYTTQRIGGEDHSPHFQCTITMWDRTVYMGDACGSKRDAESSAASKVLSRMTYLEHEETVVLVDADNFPNFAGPFSRDTSTIYVFHSKDCKVSPIYKGDDSVCIHDIESPTIYASHIAMSVCMGALLHEGKFTNYVIVAGNKMATGLCDMISRNVTGLYKGQKATHVKK